MGTGDPTKPAGEFAAWLIVSWLAVYLVVSTNLIVMPIFADYYDARRVLQLGLLGASVLTVLASWELRVGVARLVGQLPQAAVVIVVSVLGVGLASALRAPLPRAGLREVALLALVGLLALVVAVTRARLGRRFDLTIIATLVASIFTYAVLFVVLRRAHISLLGFESLTDRPWAHFYGWSNARFFGQVGVWTFPLLAAAPLLLSSRTRLTRAGAWMVGVAWWALVLEAGGRGSILVTIVATVVTPFVLGGAAWRWLRSASAMLAGGTVLWLLANRLMQAMYAPDSEAALNVGLRRAIDKGTSDNFRFSFWQEAVEMIAASPLLGVGPEHYAYYQRGMTSATPHNIVLQFASEWGLPVAGLILTLAVWGGISWIKRWRIQPPVDTYQSSLVAGLTASGLGAAMLSMVEGVTVAPASQVMLALVLGWMLALYGTSTRDNGALVSANRRQVGPGSTVHAAISGSAVLLMAVLIWSASPYLWSPQETMQEEFVKYELEYLYPRFWLQGRLFDY